jgi:hypothetical protein
MTWVGYADTVTVEVDVVVVLSVSVVVEAHVGTVVHAVSVTMT